MVSIIIDVQKEKQKIILTFDYLILVKTTAVVCVLRQYCRRNLREHGEMFRHVNRVRLRSMQNELRNNH
jgi:hypothetical protein